MPKIVAIIDLLKELPEGVVLRKKGGGNWAISCPSLGVAEIEDPDFGTVLSNFIAIQEREDF